MQKFSHKLPKEDLKKFAKEVGKKLVASDFKNGRVEDPTKISEKQEKKVKKYVREFFERAVEKKKAIDKRKAENKARLEAKTKAEGSVGDEKAEKEVEDGDSPELEDAEPEVEGDIEEPDMVSAPGSPNLGADDGSDLKRKRDQNDESSPGYEVESPNKRLKEEDSLDASAAPSPPPPPPPPPAEGMPESGAEGMNGEVAGETEEEKDLRQQEEALIRENEEAMLQDLKDNAEARNGVTKEANGVSTEAKHEHEHDQRKEVLSH